MAAVSAGSSSSCGSRLAMAGAPSPHPRSLSPRLRVDASPYNPLTGRQERIEDAEQLGEQHLTQRQTQAQHPMLRSFSPGGSYPLGKPPLSAGVRDLSPRHVVTGLATDSLGASVAHTSTTIVGQRLRDMSPSLPTHQASSPPAGLLRLRETSPDTIPLVKGPSPSVKSSHAAPPRPCESGMASPAAKSPFPEQASLRAASPITPVVSRQHSAPQAQTLPNQVLSPWSPAAHSSNTIASASPRLAAPPARSVVRPPWAQLPQVPKDPPQGSASIPFTGRFDSQSASPPQPASAPSQPKQPHLPSPPASPSPAQRELHSLDQRHQASERSPQASHEIRVANSEVAAKPEVQQQQNAEDLIEKERRERMADIAALRSELTRNLTIQQAALLDFTHMLRANKLIPADLQNEAPKVTLPNSASATADAGAGDTTADAGADAAGGCAEGGLGDVASSARTSRVPSLEVMMEQLAKSVMEQQRQQDLQAAALREGLMELQHQRDKVSEVCSQYQAISGDLEAESATRRTNVVELAEKIRLELGPVRHQLELVSGGEDVHAQLDAAMQAAERQREDLLATIEAERSARGRELAEIRALLPKQQDREVEPQVAQIFRALAEERSARSREFSELKVHLEDMIGAAVDEKFTGSNCDIVRLAGELRSACSEVQVYSETISKEQALRREEIDSIRAEVKELKTTR